MISYIHGKLVSKTPTELIIDVHGIGYHVNIPLSTFEKLEKVKNFYLFILYRKIYFK